MNGRQVNTMEKIAKTMGIDLSFKAYNTTEDRIAMIYNQYVPDVDCIIPPGSLKAFGFKSTDDIDLDLSSSCIVNGEIIPYKRTEYPSYRDKTESQIWDLVHNGINGSGGVSVSFDVDPVRDYIKKLPKAAKHIHVKVDGWNVTFTGITLGKNTRDTIEYDPLTIKCTCTDEYQKESGYYPLWYVKKFIGMAKAHSRIDIQLCECYPIHIGIDMVGRDHYAIIIAPTMIGY